MKCVLTLNMLDVMHQIQIKEMNINQTLCSFNQYYDNKEEVKVNCEIEYR